MKQELVEKSDLSSSRNDSTDLGRPSQTLGKALRSHNGLRQRARLCHCSLACFPNTINIDMVDKFRPRRLVEIRRRDSDSIKGMYIVLIVGCIQAGIKCRILCLGWVVSLNYVVFLVKFDDVWVKSLQKYFLCLRLWVLTWGMYVKWVSIMAGK